MFEAVIFDCDGCLIDSEVLALEVELEALAEVGLTYDRAEFCRRFMGLSNPVFFAALDEDRRARLGEPLPPTFQDLHAERLTAAVDARLTEVAGAAAAVARLARPKAVATSSHAAFVERKLRRVGLWDAFTPHIYTADRVGRGKPAPDLFLHAAEQLGADPAECLAIEDSQNGVIAARAAGMTVWALTAGGHILPEDPQRLAQAGAHRIVPTWAEAGEDFARWP